MAKTGEADVDAPTRLGRLLTFPLLAEHGHGHIDPSRMNAAVDGGEGNLSCAEATDDLFRRPGRTQLPDDCPAHRVIELGAQLVFAFS